MSIYHKDVYMPESAANLQYAAMLKYSKHALHAAKTDRYGEIQLPKIIDSRSATLIEVEMENDRVVKVVFRVEHDEEHDLTLAILTDTALVKTVWLNRKDDEHTTLRKEKYATT